MDTVQVRRETLKLLCGNFIRDTVQQIYQDHPSIAEDNDNNILAYLFWTPCTM